MQLYICNYIFQYFYYIFRIYRRLLSFGVLLESLGYVMALLCQASSLLLLSHIINIILCVTTFRNISLLASLF